MPSIPTESQLEQAAGPDSPAPAHGKRNRETADRESLSLAAEAEIIGQRLARQFKAHRADLKRSLFQLVTTATPFLALLVVMASATEGHYWLTLLLAIPTAGLLVRLFIIQHDCGHGSYFKSRAANDFLGRVLGILTLTPYTEWAQSHAAHHASNGNLDRRGAGDVETLTVREYQAATPLKKLGYRLFRNPLILVLVGAPLTFIVLQRLPIGRAFRDPQARSSVLLLNLALVVAFGLPMMVIGVVPVLATYLPVMIIASWIGHCLFYIQHQFEDTYWERDGEWNFHTAALRGSSHFDLPPILQWFSGNIGLHHVHHLCSRIPNYRLQTCHDAAPELRRVTKRITLRDSLKCWRLSLWDEQRNLLVPLRDLKAQSA
jgi:omega-6 fatty acid desaturase (delta-12 desaturase)